MSVFLFPPFGAMWASSSSTSCYSSRIGFPPRTSAFHHRRSRGFCRRLFCRSELSPAQDEKGKKKVVVVGAGWAGLASAHHLSNQGYEVTLLEAGNGLTEEMGMRGFWYPYRNIFSLIDQLQIEPFTKWIKSSYYSLDGLEVEFPVFQNQPKLPAPFGALAYPQFARLPLADRLSSLALILAVIDFDNTDTAWRKYDKISARELFKKFGISKRLYEEIFEPAIQTGLFANGEQISASATLAMLYYYILSHQQNFDFVLCRGGIRETIFCPWLESLKAKGLKFYRNRIPTDFRVDKNGVVREVICGGEVYEADAFILSLGVSSLQNLILNSPVLQRRREFLNVLKLSTSDLVSVKLWFDKKITIPNPAIVCCGFDDSIAWTFFDLNSVFDEYKEESGSVLEFEFYGASNLLPLKDEQIVENTLSKLTKCIKEFQDANIVQQKVVKHPKSATQFSPGSYKYMVGGATTFPNLFMAGDWIVNRHGSWSKEKAYVTGLEAANRAIDYFCEGEFAKIIPVEEDESHIETLRELNRRANEIFTQLPFSDFFL